MLVIMTGFLTETTCGYPYIGFVHYMLLKPSICICSVLLQNVMAENLWPDFSMLS